jgi:hypothetical protein
MGWGNLVAPCDTLDDMIQCFLPDKKNVWKGFKDERENVYRLPTQVENVKERSEEEFPTIFAVSQEELEEAERERSEDNDEPAVEHLTNPAEVELKGECPAPPTSLSKCRTDGKCFKT